MSQFSKIISFFVLSWVSTHFINGWAFWWFLTCAPGSKFTRQNYIYDPNDYNVWFGINFGSYLKFYSLHKAIISWRKGNSKLLSWTTDWNLQRPQPSSQTTYKLLTFPHFPSAIESWRKIGLSVFPFSARITDIRRLDSSVEMKSKYIKTINDDWCGIKAGGEIAIYFSVIKKT